MIHKFKMNKKNIILDVNSGCVHEVDDLAYDMIDYLDERFPKEISADILNELSKKYNKADILETYDEIYSSYKNKLLFSEDTYNDIALKMKKQSPVKAMCLHVAHDCNLRCKYCFADEGTYHKRAVMSEETAKQAIDFLINNSGKRKNLEIDFFGGEPLMNFDVVKAAVEYAREQEIKFDKNFRFTITTNGLLLNDENIDYINKNMYNIVLSLDGRRDVNDKMRYRADGTGSYDSIVPKLLKVADLRGQDNYYVRGTFTRENMDFSKDVLHLADLGFKQTSVEPVVAGDDRAYALRREDLPVLFKEYETLAEEYVNRKKNGRGFNFFHFMIDLEQGPCVIKRLSGCGAGCEYLAVTPEGDVFPCHQFVGIDEYKMGNVSNGDINRGVRQTFENCNVYAKEKCRDCFAKFYCSGGCMANACIYNNDINVPHEISCELQKKRIECAIYIKVVEASDNI